jgi:DNA-directed RNA polymerase sigma subunit (sigma70/sigma32)
LRTMPGYLYGHQVWHATRLAAQEQEGDEAEAWLEMADEIEKERWRWHVRQALLEVIVKLPARLERLIRLIYGLDEPGPNSLAAIGRAWGIRRERVRLQLQSLSMRLRSLCQQNCQAAYLQALALNRAWQRSQRRRR